jgi:hypothetical protein
MPDTLSAGGIYTLATNTVYSLPPRVVRVHSTVVLEISPDQSAWDSLTNADTVGAEAGSGFVRSTTGAAIVAVRYVG